MSAVLRGALSMALTEMRAQRAANGSGLLTDQSIAAVESAIEEIDRAPYAQCSRKHDAMAMCQDPHCYARDAARRLRLASPSMLKALRAINAAGQEPRGGIFPSDYREELTLVRGAIEEATGSAS